MIIDTHAHLMFDKFEGEVDEVINRAREAGVEKIINVGCTLKASKQAVEMAEKYDDLFATVGLHPYDAADCTPELMEEWQKLIESNQKIVAVGEIGLDYFKSEVPKDIQKKAFRMQLELSIKAKVPVIVHNRDADDDALEILDEFPDADVVFHCYGSTVEYARKLWYKGYMTSFTGIITFPTAETLINVVDEVPMDKLMVETDCPYLAPQPHRGKRNEPAFVMDVVDAIAEIKGSTPEEIARVSTENALEFFFRMNR